MKLPESKKNKMIYNSLNYSFIDEKYIKNTYYNGKYSKNSFMFSLGKNGVNKDDTLKLIEEIFDIKFSLEERKKYEDAVHGSGSEIRKIAIMHSSSLCAFLHFFRISKDNPITIDNVIYDEVYFEVQNDVVGGNPSNVDVVLKSNRNKKILFLECKFSEYLDNMLSVEISNKYYDEYQDLKLSNIYSCSVNGDKIKLSSKEDESKTYHFDCIKQIISHYIGIGKFILDKKDKNNILELGDCEVLLGTILFDGNWDKKYINDYRDEYKTLSKHLNSLGNNFKVIDDIYTYQEVFRGFDLPKKVRLYYCEDE